MKAIQTLGIHHEPQKNSIRVGVRLNMDPEAPILESTSNITAVRETEKGRHGVKQRQREGCGERERNVEKDRER